MGYSAQNIRNICFLGHGGDGKTALAESMLYLTKGTDRLGKTAEGNTVSDFDAEEIKRQYSISTSVLPVEYKGTKINVLDNPGYFDFAGEVMQAVRVCGSGVIVCTAKSGAAVGTEKAWKYLNARNLPFFIYISKIDEEHADYYKTLDGLRQQFGNKLVPIVIPITEGDKNIGLVDIIHQTAYIAGQGEGQEIPESVADYAEMYYNALCETVAETSEEKLDKFFGGEPFTEEEILEGIRQGVLDHSVIPVFCGSAYQGIGTDTLMRGIVDFAPTPAEHDVESGTDADGNAVEIHPTDSDPVLFVFKTVSDQYGKQSFFKVISGNITPDMSLYDSRTGTTEKLGHIYTIKGKKTTEVKELCAGDIGVVAKLANVKTGDTLCAPGKNIVLAGIDYPTPCHSRAVYAKAKGQEEKIAAGLNKLNEEDCSFSVVNDTETKEMVISGAGDIHLDVLCSKLKSKFGVEADLREPKIAYRETIKKKVEVHGRHKKQSGGHGQFGDVYIRFEPQSETEDMIFADETVGGCVPKNFIPSVEKGLRNCISKGVLAGYPVVFLKATLYFGSYHPVDSSDMAFQTAAGLAYKEGLPTAGPTILEPISELKVTVPDANMGDIFSDISKRRGRVIGQTPDDDGNQVVEAEVPAAELRSYAIDLRSMTQGRGSFTTKFVRYEEVPVSSQAAIIEEAKKNEE